MTPKKKKKNPLQRHSLPNKAIYYRKRTYKSSLSQLKSRDPRVFIFIFLGSRRALLNELV